METASRVRDAVAALLAALQAKSDQYRVAHEGLAESLAPKFTPFAYIPSDECDISRVIHDLLDPRGLHGQRERFLRLFLEVVGLDTRASTPNARVTLESQTFAQNSKRRIDIVIRDRDWIVGIEHKPWARDQVCQITDYLKELRLRGARQVHLLYITTDGRRPSEASIQTTECDAAIRRGEFKAVSYADLARWLDRCIEVCRAERVTWFLRAFQDFVRRATPGGRAAEKETTMMVDALLDASNQPHFAVALELLQAKDAVRRALMGRLMSAIKARLPDWTITRELSPEDAGLEMRPPAAKGWYFCVEYDAGRWFYGIKRDEDVNAARRAALSSWGERLRGRFSGAGRPTDYWPIWWWFRGIHEHDPESYSNWETSAQPWLDMYDGTMADHFAALARQIHEAAKD